MQHLVRILVLAARLQPFLMANLKTLLMQEHITVLLVHWPGTKDTPAPALPVHPSLQVIQKEAGNTASLSRQLYDYHPDIVLAPGWMDKEYLRWTKHAKDAGAVTIMSMDNQWNGNFRQWINCLLSTFRLRKIYHYTWVPGQQQYHYACRLGFSDQHILTGYCTPDIGLFYDYYQHIEKAALPKAFLYAGRLVAHKFEGLLLAFHGLTAVQRAGWKLIVVGEGPLEAHPAMNDPDIIRIPYQPQEQLGNIIRQSGVFCLTSSNEPWGTAIQEYATAGFPLLLSNACGAAPHFLIDDYNGHYCNSTPQSISSAMLRFIKKPQPELLSMRERSHRLGTVNNNEMWVAKLLSVLAAC